MHRCKELHLFITTTNKEFRSYPIRCTYSSTKLEVDTEDIVYTTQTHFLSWNYAERLLVHIDGEIHEITEGKCEGTNREIKVGHNLEKLLLSGEFDYIPKDLV